MVGSLHVTSLVKTVFGNRAKLDVLDRNTVIEQMHEHGVLLFRGFSVDDGDFVRFTRRFSTQFLRRAAPTLEPNCSQDGTTVRVLAGKSAIALLRLKLSGLYYQNTVWVGSHKEQTEMCCKWKNTT